VETSPVMPYRSFTDILGETSLEQGDDGGVV
jgi:hypothetical protein